MAPRSEARRVGKECRSRGAPQQAKRKGSANTTAGQGYFLQSYAAVFIGCTVSKSGVPCVVGTLIGAAVLAVLANGLTILQMPSFMQNIITGGIIILAVVIQKIGAGKN